MKRATTTLQQQQDRDAKMVELSKETQTTLRGEYGGEYDGNMNAALELLKVHLGEEGKTDFLAMRLEDGTRIQDNTDIVRMLVNIGTDYYGGNSIMTGDVETTTKTLEEQKAELLALRNSDPERFKSDAVQEKLTKIYAQLDRINAR